MSFGYNNISDLIEKEAEKLPDLNAEQKKSLADLCKRLYLIKSTSASRGARSPSMRDRFVGEITRLSNEFAKTEV